MLSPAMLVSDEGFEGLNLAMLAPIARSSSRSVVAKLADVAHYHRHIDQVVCPPVQLGVY